MQLVKQLCTIKGQSNKQNPLPFESFSDKDRDTQSHEDK